MARNSYNTDNFLNIARGRIPFTSHINKFGYNFAVGSTYQVICDLGTHNYPTSAGVVSVVSASTADDGDPGGTGARTVEIQGLDGDYNPLIETVTMNGTSAVTTTNSFIRLFRMRVVSAGTGLVNAGNITASIGGADTAKILADKGQTLMAVYTVPAGKDAFLIKFQGTLSKNQEANFRLRIKEIDDGTSYNVKGIFGTFANSITYDYPIPLKFKEKTDIEVQGKAGATSEMGALFDLILIDNTK